MQGFEGPFHFEIDSEGSFVPWDSLPEQTRERLKENSHMTTSNSSVYYCGISAVPHHKMLEKHHNWAKVNRVLIEARPVSEKSIILGIFPASTKTQELDQEPLPFADSLIGEATLFEALKFRLNISNLVKHFARPDRYAVLASHTRKLAQWVYSRGWEELGYQMYLYIAVPHGLAEEQRALSVSVTPVRKRNKKISLACVYDHKVKLPS